MKRMTTPVEVLIHRRFYVILVYMGGCTWYERFEFAAPPRPCFHITNIFNEKDLFARVIYGRARRESLAACLRWVFGPELRALESWLVVFSLP